MSYTDTFEFSLPANGIVFGAGTAVSVGERASRLGARKVLLMTDKQVRGAGLVDPIHHALRVADHSVDVFDEVATEPTFPAVAASVEMCKRGGYDTIVAVGGGSTLDSAKATSVLSSNPGTFMEYTDPARAP